MAEIAAPNGKQAELWNQTSGNTWVEMQPVLDRMLEPFGALLLDQSFPGEGRRVLDIGCGAGATTIGMAKRLGPGGACVGLDISAPLLSAARAQAADTPNASFVLADAQTFAFETGAFDAAISRFGVMFFDDPAAAFANIRRAMRPGAKLTFLAWRSPAENPFFGLAAQAVADLVAFPEQPPNAPGQFAFADRRRVVEHLESGGWRSITIDAVDVPTEIPEADLLAYATRLGPLGGLFPSLDRADQARATEALRAACEPHVKDGAARFSGACWLVKATA